MGAIHVYRTPRSPLPPPGILATRTGLKYAQAGISISSSFKKSTQRRLVKPCKDAAGSEDDLVTV